MNQPKSVFLTLLIGVIVLAGLDIVFNQGGTIAALMPDRTAVSTPYLDNQNLVNSVPDPRIVLDTSQPATVVFGQPPQPQIVTATPGAPVVVLESPTPTETPTQQPESVIDYTDDILAQPTRDYQLTDDQLASCIAAQVEQRRLAPYCPPNPAEYAGPGR